MTIRVFLVVLFIVATKQQGDLDEEPPCNLVDQAQNEAKTYLEQFGYIPHPFQQPGQPDTRNLTDGIIKFQKFNGLNVTGVLDNATRTLFNTPRCGLPDTPDDGPEEFVTSNNKWTSSNNLLYRIDSYTSDLSRGVIRQILKDAWQVWADVTPLTFTEVGSGQTADFKLKFESDDHRDGYPFDGSGGVLAHAFYPTSGRCHFDDDERWTHRTSAGINLFSVAVHEFGHSLGLKHSSASGSVMAPYYQGYQGNSYSLGADDVQGIQYLYGVNSGGSGSDSGGSSNSGGSSDEGPSPTPPPSTPPSSACSGKMDAVVKTTDGSLFGFIGSYVWDLTGPLTGGLAMESTFRSKFNSDWTDFHAAVTDKDGITYILKECNALVFINTNYIRRIDIRQKWRGLPCHVNAAFMDKDGYFYFFFGSYYYKFKDGEFVTLSFIYYIGWSGLPSALFNGFDAISDLGDNFDKMYIFKGDQYWRLDQVARRFDNGYPKDTKDIWLKRCL